MNPVSLCVISHRYVRVTKFRSNSMIVFPIFENLVGKVQKSIHWFKPKVCARWTIYILIHRIVHHHPLSSSPINLCISLVRLRVLWEFSTRISKLIPSNSTSKINQSVVYWLRFECFWLTGGMVLWNFNEGKLTPPEWILTTIQNKFAKIPATDSAFGGITPPAPLAPYP